MRRRNVMAPTTASRSPARHWEADRRWRVGLIAAALAGAALAGAAWAAKDSGQLERLNLRETELTAEQSRNMSQLARLLSIVEQLRRDPPPALLVSPDDARDAARAAMLVRAMAPELQQRARSYAQETGEMMRRRRLAAVASEALFTTESERAEAAPLAEPGPGQGGGSGRVVFTGPVTPPERLFAPVSGPLTRRFGERAPGGGRSNGLSYAASRAAPVSSPGAGVVQYVGPVKGWGVILILRLAGGYHLVLAGLAQTSVAVGQSVAPGQPVGWMPDARQSPSEIYLEVRERGVPIDPARWMTG